MDGQNLPSTENVHPTAGRWAHASTLEALHDFSAADQEALRAVEGAREDLAQAIDSIAPRLIAGGRLFYVGAGTSGRLAALDAAECPPTFQSDPTTVQAILAGGPGAMLRAVEGAEDDESGGAQAIAERGVQAGDCVLGISASGGAPFVHGALRAAREQSAWTGLLTCVPNPPHREALDACIRLLTGAELLSGSTRMKAGTATKMALSALSTLVMARLGKVYGHRMVDVATHGNKKLWRRGVRLVGDIASVEEGRAETLLREAQGSVKVAVVMEMGQVSESAARKRLAAEQGHLDRVLTDLGVHRIPPASS